MKSADEQLREEVQRTDANLKAWLRDAKVLDRPFTLEEARIGIGFVDHPLAIELIGDRLLRLGFVKHVQPGYWVSKFAGEAGGARVDELGHPD